MHDSDNTALHFSCFLVEKKEKKELQEGKLRVQMGIHQQGKPTCGEKSYHLPGAELRLKITENSSNHDATRSG